MAEHAVNPLDLLQKFSDATDEVKEEAKKPSKKSNKDIVNEIKNMPSKEKEESKDEVEDIEELKKKLNMAIAQIDSQNKVLESLNRSNPLPILEGVGVGLGSIIISEPLEVIEVRVNVDNACIGGKYYSFRAGEKYKVSRDVAQTLREAKKL